MIDRVLVLGSGALKIGEAGEFDYSGTQALKALKEEGIYTILINPNIATVQTSKRIADKIYFLPIKFFFVKNVICKENPDAILISFGGQTALNCGIELFNKGILDKYKIKVLGTSVKSIINSEDRYLFRNKLEKINIKTAKSLLINSYNQAISYSKYFGFPLIIRSAYTLGGLGSGLVRNIDDLKNLIKKSLSYSSQIVMEEYLEGWKEIEYEIMRDKHDNCIAVCNMENVDPVGIHTGESIVVAPSQTLTNTEYFKLRRLAINIARHFNIIGECNVQFALHPKSEKYRVIEMNARLSRSSALASKATGYPIAFISAKLSLGYGLHELKNSVTKYTSAFFEPALDYVVCKIPRWDLDKFNGVSRNIGSSMKSIGEVMAIGGNFEEALQKGIRMLDIGLQGFININKKTDNNKFSHTYLKKKLQYPTDKRIFFMGLAMSKGFSIQEIHNLTKIDLWFLYQLNNILKIKNDIENFHNWQDIPYELLEEAKKSGFSDFQIAKIFFIKNSNENVRDIEHKIREYRKKIGIIPHVRQIDTLAAEYPAHTNYLYLTYHSIENDICCENDEKSVIILGSGVYRIGSSVEFDWCCVNTLNTINTTNYRSVLINYNPETVSTDFDSCNRLYFEELSLERVLDIVDFERPKGLIVSMGGQISNNLVLKLYEKKVKILGTSPVSIDKVENRQKFSKIMDDLDIKQPKWKILYNDKSIYEFIKKVNFPILIRPSYVLSGSNMHVIYNQIDLKNYLLKNKNSNLIRSFTITKFIENASEIEFDAVSQNGVILYYSISEHIEYAGVHSGDATLICPPCNININVVKKIIKVSKKISQYFNISGPFNVQFIYKQNKIQVIECNLRASRSFPFVSKVSRFNMIELATKVILGIHGKKEQKINKLLNYNKYFGVKASQFSFSRLNNVDPLLGVEMLSTGEVGCFGDTMYEAFLKAMISVGYSIPKKNILISIESLKFNMELLSVIKILYKKGYIFFSTNNTHSFLYNNKILSKKVELHNIKKEKDIFTLISNKKMDLIINIPTYNNNLEKNKYYFIRRYAIDYNVPLFTNLRLAKYFMKAFCMLPIEKLYIKSWDDY